MAFSRRVLCLSPLVLSCRMSHASSRSLLIFVLLVICTRFQVMTRTLGSICGSNMTHSILCPKPGIAFSLVINSWFGETPNLLEIEVFAAMILLSSIPFNQPFIIGQ